MHRRSEIEPVVDAGANDILGEGDADSDGAAAARRRARLAAKIDVEIFYLGGPVLPQDPLYAGADGPANLGRGTKRIPAAGSNLAIGGGGATRRVEEQAIERVAGAAAQCGEPMALTYAAALVRPIAITLDAGYKMIPLVIGADRAAGLKPVHAEGAVSLKYCRVGKKTLADSIAAVDAEIDTAPIVDRRRGRNIVGGWDWRRYRWRRKIGRDRPSPDCERECSRNPNSFHSLTPPRVTPRRLIRPRYKTG